MYRRSPISVAAAAIFMASQASEDKKSQKGIYLFSSLLTYFCQQQRCKLSLVLTVFSLFNLEDFLISTDDMLMMVMIVIII